ncbi:exostosin domain-containing protein [Granulosicoccus antarcticus]|uniref:Exostosin GT47 domain-containing protein n=1 Tax=Granulosicoccus antarcticus IMCC3135 TaxID=1192854 RepID=A0A2Z2NRF3_9GAMM|nr:exostosin family protein [Granulosicoccus antarcticus]ASJ72318.1 hypothetical protein IMCC3135_11135 [Granulosicoccus antarcticus IMCC3135]
MKLLFTSAYSTHPCLDRVRQLQRLDDQGNFTVTRNPDKADAIVFVENTQFQDMSFNTLMEHPLIRMYPEKIFMYNEMDRAWPLLHGLYCSLGSELTNPEEQVAFPYLTATNSGVQDIYHSKAERQWLYSFVGSASHACRKPVLRLKDDNARIIDTSDFCTWDPIQTSKYAFQKLYTQTMAGSKFILCPRGIGPASLRLYETMESGRVPVIISDSWVAPPQVDWSFAVRVPESRTSDIPKILLELEPQWQERGEAARRAWETSYAPNRMFNTMGLAIQSIRKQSPFPEPTLRANTMKWAVVAEQKLRNQLKPTPSDPAPRPSFLGRMFSRKA